MYQIFLWTMKNFILLFSVIFNLVLNHNDDKVYIQGTVTNSDGEFISLNYEPRLRGIFSFDGFKTIGCTVDKNGNFILKSDKITDEAYYSLTINDNGVLLVLFKGDNLTCNFDAKNLANSFFAKGKGAGKINVLRLHQFQYIKYNPKWTIDEFGLKTDSIVAAKLSLLNAIYKQKPDQDILHADNKSEILRIIQETPLSKNEYEFLKKRITFEKYSVLDFVSATSTDTTSIDFSSPAFSSFNKNEYRKIDNLNNWYFAEALDKILTVEYLRYKQQENGPLILKDWNTTMGANEYSDWVSGYLKTEFSKEVHDKYYSDMAAYMMTLGLDANEQLDYIEKNCKNKKYISKLTAFNELLNSGLSKPDYNLSNEVKTLDSLKFNSLLEHHKQQNTVFVFWSAQYAGASIINKITSLQNFQYKRQDINVINICIDKGVNKNLWAARVIDSGWKGEHYFMPVESNESTLNKFSNKK